MSMARDAALTGGPGDRTAPTLDAERVRSDFPALDQAVHGRRLVYLDNAATTQKPRAVLEAVQAFYEHDCSNVHRGVHELSLRATESYEKARETVRRFLGASSEKDVVFVRGTTEAINLVAQSFVRPRVGPGDEILITEMEHHSNIVPWQLACEQTGATLKVAPMNDAGELLLDRVDELLGPRTRFVSVVHVSNALGTVNPVGEIVARAKARDVPVLLDGAQAVPHRRLDVESLGCDFYAFSGHKAYAPMGIGALWARADRLAEMPPWQGGGDMILSVSFEGTRYNEPPYKFEAGTPNVGGAVGLAAALDYLESLGLEAVASHEDELLAHALERLVEVPGLRLVGEPAERAGVISFVVDGVHAHDIGTVLDQHGVAIRTGHHCAEPVVQHYGLPATARASVGAYNTREDMDLLVEALHECASFFRS